MADPTACLPPASDRADPDAAPRTSTSSSATSSRRGRGGGPATDNDNDERFERLMDAMEAQSELMHRYLRKLDEQHGANASAEAAKRQVLCDYYTSSSYNTTVVISALIITCCFTALLQPPGGAAGGAAALDSRASFKVFFALNGMAMGTACVTILLLMGGRPVTARGANVLLLLGRSLVSFAVHFTLGAFLAGAFIVTQQVAVLAAVMAVSLVALVGYYALYACQHEVLDRVMLPPLLERNLSSKFMISVGRKH